MAVRAIAKRRIPKGKEKEAVLLIDGLRMLASRNPGYISAEIMLNIEDSEDCLIVSTWETIDDLNNFLADPIRKKLQARIDSALGQTKYTIYHYKDSFQWPGEGVE